MLLLTLAVEQVVNGLFLGAIYLLIALGLSLIFSLGGIVNLAHGAFYAIGAYLTIVLSPALGFGDNDPEIDALVRAAAATFEQLGAAVDEVAVEKVPVLLAGSSV